MPGHQLRMHSDSNFAPSILAGTNSRESQQYLAFPTAFTSVVPSNSAAGQPYFPSSSTDNQIGLLSGTGTTVSPASAYPASAETDDVKQQHFLSPQDTLHIKNMNTNSAGSSGSLTKRPASGPDLRSSDGNLPNKKPKLETEASRSHHDDRDGEEEDVTVSTQPQVKVKATRGSRACTVCRRLKMKCVGAENGPPCKRCIAGKHECIFEESNRGKRSSKKHEVLTKSIKKMELTLETVMKNLNNPALASLITQSNTTTLHAASTDGVAERSHSRSASPIVQASNGPHHAPRIAMDSPLDVVNVHILSPANSTTTTGRSPLPSTKSVTSSITRVADARSPSSVAGAARSMSMSQQPLSPQLSSHLPDNSLNPLGLLAEASLSNRRSIQKAGGVDDDTEAAHMVEQAVNGSMDEDGTAKTGPYAAPGRKVGVANDSYFRPSPISILPLRRLFIERQVQPEMLGLVTTEEVVELFKIYFEKMNRHCCLLSQDFHTPSLVCSRSPFLLTVVCSIASKFYTPRPDLHPQLVKISRKLAFSVPERGFKSLEIVQAYLLLALWGCGPVDRYEQDKTWLLLGLAIRMGTDLNLHRKVAGLPSDAPPAEWRARERELRNRERTWILCYVLDRSCSAQMGKPHSVIEDYIIRNTATWYKLPECRTTDAGLVAYAELQRIMSRSLDFLYSGTSTTSGLHTNTDYLLVIKTIESQILTWSDYWDYRNLSKNGGIDVERITAAEGSYVSTMIRFYLNYSMLVVNSFGLQNALEHAPLDTGHFFGRCYSSAVACAVIVRDELGPQGYLRYSPDSHFVFSSYVVLMLLKVSLSTISLLKLPPSR
ncbi:uncharacterized protein EI90DRAFT_1755923 [Cantharellus anzutake]|uniref:uncharacterized protein n=1 Tax=Cantharellus anzutake TaxID=1750568 RepID=UPI0019077954|nr:uncharacterized protein EI90DRAFT_1755923 [Cantharellus anzutake]KAF8341576.1 hypothetical protein EI90DRAFT_1755923 [Cantharellus anzutake]